MPRKIRDLSDDELIEEWRFWNNKIENAKSWGASLAAANEFRKECEIQIALRGLDDPERDLNSNTTESLP